MGCQHGEECGGNHEQDLEQALEMYPSLYKYTNVDRVYGYNEKRKGSAKKLFRPHHERETCAELEEFGTVFESADGPECILIVPFTMNVKILGIQISGGIPVESSPSSLKLFVNRDDIDFANVHSIQPTQEISLAKDFNPLYYPLKAFKFSNVHCVTLFFPQAFNFPTLSLSYINFHGLSTNMKKDTVVTVYESQPNLADHPEVKDEFKNQHSVF